VHHNLKLKPMFKKVILLIFIAIHSLVHTQIKLPSFFTDHMVLQQDKNVTIWGYDKPKSKIKVTGSWGEDASVKSEKDGSWKVQLKTPIAGGSYTLVIDGSTTVTIQDVMIGEVWLCSGQSNMQMTVYGYGNQPVNGSQEAILNAENSKIRMFTAKRAFHNTPQNNVEGDWQLAAPATVGSFSAAAYFFGKKLESVLDVPIGLIVTSWGGSSAEAWTDKETLAQFNSIQIPEEVNTKRPNQSPTALYNGMLHPFIGYAIKGAIWYQGEANRNRASEYNALMAALITSWRSQWNQGSFPFYFTQIAPFNYGNGTNSALLREAQLHTMQTLENTGMAVTLDIGDAKYIHPREKKTVGDRLAYWALAKDYGIQGIEYSGPIYKEIKSIANGKIELLFENSPHGINSFGKELTGFEIAGEDKIFYPAKAKIGRSLNVVMVSSEQVPTPVAVRYAFKNTSEATLFSTAGLPASSFRTDTWEE